MQSNILIIEKQYSYSIREFLPYSGKGTGGLIIARWFDCSKRVKDHTELQDIRYAHLYEQPLLIT